VVRSPAGANFVHSEGGQLELHRLLELVHVRSERLDRRRLRAQHARVVPLRRLRRPQVELLEDGALLCVLCVDPRLMVSDRVDDSLERAHGELHDVMVVDQVARGRRDAEVGVGRQLDILHLKAVEPLAALAQRRLLQSQLERLKAGEEGTRWEDA